MGINAIIVLIIIFVAIFLFASELLPIDLTALLIIASLVVTRVVTPEEGVAGFSNSATVTVAFMFVLSTALHNTGVLQLLGPWLSSVFRRNFTLGMVLMMLLIGIISSFINNTPVVAVFIPVIMQLSSSIGKSPSKILIPLSYAAIFGGSCTLIGTSTNILVNGIAEMNGVKGFSMFTMSPLGIILLVIGIVYMLVIGIRLLPSRKPKSQLGEKFGTWNYVTEMELLEGSSPVGKSIMESSLVKDYDLDIIEIRRNNNRFTLPSGDMVLLAGDILKVHCNVEKLNSLKDRMHIHVRSPIKLGEESFTNRNTSMAELIITADSEFNGKTLREADFRRKYRAVPLAIRTRDEIFHEKLHDVELKSGDVLLAEIKTFYMEKLKKLEGEQRSPFIILSEEIKHEFNPRKTIIVLCVLVMIVLTAALDIIPIMMGTITGVCLLIFTGCMKMKEMYKSINWDIVFLLAGALSLGVAMQKTGLADSVSVLLVNSIGNYGPVAVISGLYLVTSVLTSLMSNNASAALLAPIAIASAERFNANPLPFLMAVTFAASASFMTPIGYQTNTMIYNAGQYKFLDFIKVGTLLNFIFWIIVTFLIPLIYPL